MQHNSNEMSRSLWLKIEYTSVSHDKNSSANGPAGSGGMLSLFSLSLVCIVDIIILFLVGMKIKSSKCWFCCSCLQNPEKVLIQKWLLYVSCCYQSIIVKRIIADLRSKWILKAHKIRNSSVSLDLERQHFTMSSVCRLSTMLSPFVSFSLFTFSGPAKCIVGKLIYWSFPYLSSLFFSSSYYNQFSTSRIIQTIKMRKHPSHELFKQLNREKFRKFHVANRSIAANCDKIAIGKSVITSLYISRNWSRSDRRQKQQRRGRKCRRISRSVGKVWDLVSCIIRIYWTSLAKRAV